MSNYNHLRKKELSIYKSINLTRKNGKWREKEYSHILPDDEKELNILKKIRTDFWNYYSLKKFSLHQCFNHLNSSQALCFNLFFPLCFPDTNLLNHVLLRMIEVPAVNQIDEKELFNFLSIRNEKLSKQTAEKLELQLYQLNPITTFEFEKIIDTKEETNFDFYVELPENHKVLFEIKYTENEFGTATNDLRHKQKFNNIYRQKLERVLKSEFINEQFVFSNYQIIRNLSYIDDNTTVVFIYPNKNEKLSETNKLIRNIVLSEKFSNVRICYLENLIEKMLRSNFLHSVNPIYQEFKRKYIV